MEIKNVCVIGGGMMGRQIAVGIAKYGYKVSVAEVNKAVCDQMAAWVDEYLAGRIAKGRMTEQEVADIKAKLSIYNELSEAVADADLVIEAIFEDENAKHEIFRKIAAAAKKDTIVTTNSSTMVSSLFAGDVADPSKLANFHYFNPALVMELIEVVKGDHTSQETADTLMEFARSIGKKPVLLKKEVEKFITNRIITAIANEAYWLVENGYCTFEDVDIACEKGAGHKMGPFRSKDLTGIDRNFLMMQAEYDKTGVKPRGYDLFKKQYDKGRYGQKTKHGFYDYE